MQKPINDSGEICPFHQKDVRKVCHKCPLYVQIRGMNPNTGEDIDHWGCALTFMPILTIDNTQQQRQTGAAVESFRNEMVKANEMVVRATLASRLNDPKLIEG